MFIAMNRFKIKCGSESAFEEVWTNRETFLEGVAGFNGFELLKGSKFSEHTLYATHTAWASKQAFEDWTRSEAFRKAHVGVGSTKELYQGPPELELFESVLDQ
ncbi:MAG: antibiotic biosynthesis monooxygenase [Pseudomonadales bacterium]|nr:antibiotic biosynthesis monooxygenase [Pseudomonadales bacterium]